MQEFFAGVNKLLGGRWRVGRTRGTRGKMRSARLPFCGILRVLRVLRERISPLLSWRLGVSRSAMPFDFQRAPPPANRESRQAVCRGTRLGAMPPEGHAPGADSDILRRQPRPPIRRAQTFHMIPRAAPPPFFRQRKAPYHMTIPLTDPIPVRTTRQ